MTVRHPDEVLCRELTELVEAIEVPENQGEPLLARDYVLLLMATIAAPIALSLIGGLL